MANRVFDFSSGGVPAEQEKKQKEAIAAKITYTEFDADNGECTREHPMLVIREASGKIDHHVTGLFTDPKKSTSFGYGRPDSRKTEDILRIDSRFTKLISWLGENQILVRLTGESTDEGYAVYKIREVDSGGVAKLSAEDGFLQYVIRRLLESKPPVREAADSDIEEEDSDEMKLTSLQTISDYLTCAGDTLPVNIRKWAKRNLAVARSREVGPDERRHALRALSIMLSIRWKDSYFGSIDPKRARQILDEELYGLEKVKQRVIETIIQINRTHTLPAYGLLLVGPAGTGKSQIAYAVARILQLPWTSLDMSSIHDAEQLTGSSRVYSNAKPGSIMEAFYQAGESNLVFIINELDKADSRTSQGNPADALLTLLDNLGFTDNYMECTVPTTGVYPIATANDRSRISDPLMTRFAVIEIPDYSPEEKKTIFQKFSLPKVLRRMGIRPEECVVTDDGAEAVVDQYISMPGVRDLEQAAEHLAAHALLEIEEKRQKTVRYDADAVRQILE
ncbi:MAG: AAA family ATPase [Lachnospiraceae bacterium]|jgi:ATP-dependent Lon protease